uniref:Secreted protein n=1 Tax=Romanomermis culicivorax TaxID=13658 RepID=A0A915JBZ3_ROMCU
MPPTTAATSANLALFPSMAMMIPVTHMATTTTAIARKTATASTITSNPDPRQTPIIIAAIESKLLYIFTNARAAAARTTQ